MYLPGLEPAAPPTDDHDGDGDEWYTPPEVLRAVRSLTHEGRIDLDSLERNTRLSERYPPRTSRFGDPLLRRS